MRALVVDPSGSVSCRDVPAPDAPDECLIDVTCAGICGTDLHILNGYAGFTGVLGHEFVGIVREAPPQDARWIGRRVVGEINVGCGACDWCARDEKEHCPSRTVLGIRGRSGAFAERLALPAGNLHAVPDALTDEEAVFVEPVAAACQIFRQVEITARSKVAILGDGRMGLLTAQVLASTGADVRLFGKHGHKLEAARGLGLEAYGIDRAAGAERTFDVVVDVTGRADAAATALGLVRPRGALVLKSTAPAPALLPLADAIVHEIRLIGSRCGPFPAALDLLARRLVHTGPLVTGRFPLEQVDAAFASARTGLKVLIEPQIGERRTDVLRSPCSVL